MNKTISFTNSGLIDIRAVTTFGVSSKESKDPVGYFGTGLKYSIAICLRLGCSISIFRGLEEFKFSVVREKIRVDEFDIVHMNDITLGFTTQLGKNWKMWQVFRELYCNTFDERNAKVHEGLESPRVGFTTVVVTGEPFMEVYHDRDSVILRSKPIYEMLGLDVHPQSSSHIFYRGIRVAELPSPSLRTYNIKASMLLTEDRTLSAMWKVENLLRDRVLNSPEQRFINDVLFAAENHYESNLNLCNSTTPPNKLFMDTINDSRWMDIVNKSALTVFRTYSKQGPKDPEPAELDVHQRGQLLEVLDFCTKLGFPVDKYEIIPTNDLSHSTLGMCKLKEVKMFINVRAFTLGNRVLASTIIEESVHMSKGLYDESRDMQNYLFELVVEQGERILGVRLEKFNTAIPNCENETDEIPF